MRDIQGITQKLFTQLQTLLPQTITLPTRQFIAQGIPAHDGPQFTVSFIGATQGQPGQQDQWQYPQALYFFGDFHIEIARAVPVTTGGQAGAPSATQQTAAAVTAAQDVEALLDALTTCVTANLVVQPGIRFAITSVDVLTPLGGIGAVVAVVSIGLM